MAASQLTGRDGALGCEGALAGVGHVVVTEHEAVLVRLEALERETHLHHLLPAQEATRTVQQELVRRGRREEIF